MSYDIPPPPDGMPPFKVCQGPCGRTKPWNDFPLSRKGSPGRMMKCQMCYKLARREYTDTERYKALRREWFKGERPKERARTYYQKKREADPEWYAKKLKDGRERARRPRSKMLARICLLRKRLERENLPREKAKEARDEIKELQAILKRMEEQCRQQQGS